MNDKSKMLLISIADELSISRSENDTWVLDTIYSATGRMALAALWNNMISLKNINEKNGKERCISVKYLKGKMRKIYHIFAILLEEELINEEQEKLIEEIYNAYLYNGYFYHMDSWISPSSKSSALYNRIELVRGIEPNENVYMSGLGPYRQVGGQEKLSVQTETDIEDFLHLGEGLLKYWNDLLEGIRGNDLCYQPTDLEYLRVNNFRQLGYWKDYMPINKKWGLARNGKGEKQYFLYEKNKETVTYYRIPEWRVEKGRDSYLKIASALLKWYKALPPIKAKKRQGMVYIECGYKLPVREINFLKLYSWPVEYKGENFKNLDFKRKMSLTLYPLFKSQMEKLGYEFKEEG